MALLPTLLAIGIGLALGVRWGGRLQNLTGWRPRLAPALAGGIATLVVIDLLPLSGWFPALLRIVALAAIGAFAVLNVRIGGMVLVVVGVGLNLLVTLLNWGMPVSGSALVSAGIVEEDQLPGLVLHGGRELADGAVLGFLGGTIPLPWGHVVSIGDLVLLVGIVLVTASVTRRYEVGGPGAGFRGGSGDRRGARGPRDYASALDALGRGPAPRRGPGLHPSRLPRDPSAGRPRRPGREPR